MDNNKRKFIITTLLSLLGVIVLLIGGTIAYFNWESTNNPLVDITVSEFADVIFKGGNDISISNIGPVLDYNDGEITEFTIKKRIEDELPLVITVKPTALPENLKHESFKCKLLTSSDNQTYNEAIEIDFSDKEINQAYSLLETNITDNNIKYYKVIFYIDGNMYNPDTMQGQNFEATIGVTIKTFEACSDTSNANVPVLADGMIPIMYDGTKWVKADIANEACNWYNYDNKMWANAVMVSSATRDTYMAADIGTPVEEADILAYYVWIPRYKYQLFNVAYSSVSSQLINVEFESGTASTGTVTCSVSEIGVETCTNKANGNWYTHPAFTFGNEELQGIWVGKFETTYGTNTTNVNPGNVVYETPTIKPNVTSLRNQQVSKEFQTVQYFGTNAYLTNTGVNEVDAHMMKNIEWGAVAYLKQSTYGLGTTDIGINTNNSYLTGCGPQSAGSEGYGNICNAYNTALGMSASTTGNITGVYDMSGGANEYTMGVVQDNTTTGRSPMSGISTSNNSGYIGKVYVYVSGTGYFYFDSGNTLAFPAAKYYDLYAYGTTYNDQTAYNRSHLGDATGETRSWYSDVANFLYVYIPWFVRGNIYINGSSAGVFCFSRNSGNGIGDHGFRVALSTTGA